MELLLALVCDRAEVTSEGKLDVTGVFNDLFAPGFPARQDRMVLVLAVEWDRTDQGRYSFRVDLVAPGGEPALTVDGHTDVDPRSDDRPPPRTRLVLPLEGVVFPVPGKYRFRVRMKGKEFDGPPLHLIETPDAGGGGVDLGSPGAAPGGPDLDSPGTAPGGADPDPSEADPDGRGGASA